MTTKSAAPSRTKKSSPTAPTPVATAAPARLSDSDVTAYQVSDTLWLVRAPVGDAAVGAAVSVAVPTFHVIWVDASGSMCSEIRNIRNQLKTKLATLVGPEDIVTIGWFSGPRECAILVDAQPIAGLRDLTAVHRAIDKLEALGSTCFVDPILAMTDAVARARKSHPTHAASGLFLSDGMHNAGDPRHVIAACEKAAGGFASFATVAYGWYAGMPLLQAMAQTIGGSAIQAADFRAWEPIFADILARRPASAPKVSVDVPGAPIGGFVYALTGGDIATYSVTAGKAVVAPNVDAVWWLAPTAEDATCGATVPAMAAMVGKSYNTSATVSLSAKTVDTLRATYAAVALYAQRIDAKIVKPLLRALGDVRLIKEYALAFGKQKTAAYYDTAKAATFGTIAAGQRLAAGYDPKALPPADAFTVLDLLALLATDDGCRVFPDHAAWDYRPIGRGRLDVSDLVTDDDLAGIVAGSAASVKAQTDAILASKPPRLVFVADSAPDGYAVSGIVPNAGTPNVSLRIKRTGTVDITDRRAWLQKRAFDATLSDEDRATAHAAAADLGRVPAVVSTHTYRNYAIVADGIVNVAKLPVRLSEDAWRVLARRGVLPGRDGAPLMYDPTEIHVVDVAALPVINEQMISSLSAATLLQQAYTYETVGAWQKVFNHYLKTLFQPASTKGIAEEYGAAAASALKALGITDGGFSPKSVQAEAKDVRTYREMDVVFAGLSSLPTVDAARAGKGKGAELMASALTEVEAYMSMHGLAVDAKTGTLTRAPGHLTMGGGAAEWVAQEAPKFETWLRDRVATLDRDRRAMLLEQAKAAFTVIVGPAWFTEWGEDMGDVSDAKAVKMRLVASKSMTIRVGKENVEGMIRLREKDEAI